MDVQVGDIIKLENNQFVTVSQPQLNYNLTGGFFSLSSLAIIVFFISEQHVMDECLPTKSSYYYNVASLDACFPRYFAVNYCIWP